MNQQQITQIQLDTLERELSGLYSQRATHQAKVTDAATPTGNKAADQSIQQAAVLGANTLIMLDRMIETRTAAFDALAAELAALNAASPETAPAPRRADPTLMNF